MRTNAEKPVPKYLQLKDSILRHFQDEHYEPGQKIPTEHELIEQFQVSRSTVRQALGELTNEGIIYRQAGRGSFFSGNPQHEPQRSYLIGVITPMISSYIFPHIIQGIDDIARHHQYHIVLGSSRNRPDEELHCLELLLRKNIDGLLMSPCGGFQDLDECESFRTAKGLTIPVVFLDWKIDDSDISYICLNNIEGGFKATSYLLEAGHRRIACMYPDDSIPGIHRYQGYRKALEAHGIEYDSVLDKPVKIRNWYEAKRAYVAMKELIALGDKRPSAVFCFNDDFVLRALPAIHEAGLNVPEDLSLVGYDDSDFAALPEIQLTSVIYPKYQMGKWAAEMVFDQLEHDGPRIPRQTIISPKLAIRNSVRCLNTPHEQ
jgi:GntR family transcriptional regulator of arabinose operon